MYGPSLSEALIPGNTGCGTGKGHRVIQPQHTVRKGESFLKTGSSAENPLDDYYRHLVAEEKGLLLEPSAYGWK